MAFALVRGCPCGQKEVATITCHGDVADREIFLKVYVFETVLRRAFKSPTRHGVSTFAKEHRVESLSSSFV